MSEVEDLIVPILQKIQTDLSRLNGKVDDIAEAQLRQGDKLAAIEGYLTFHMGLTTRQQADVEALPADLADVKQRLAKLEARL